MHSIKEFLESNGRNNNNNNNNNRRSRSHDHDDLQTICTNDEDTVVLLGAGQRNADKKEEESLVTAGFVTSHPRQQRKIQQKKKKQQQQQHHQQQLSTNNHASSLPTESLAAAVTTFEQHVPFSASAQRDWDRVQEALESLATQLQPPKTLQMRSRMLSQDAIPETLRQPWRNRQLHIHKSTYEANDPTEDRSTIVVGQDFLFAGVWDGHGGAQCSEFTQGTVYKNFAQAYQELADKKEQRVPGAFIRAFQKTNRDYYHYARTQNVRQAYFAGTCAVACFLDLNETLSTADTSNSSSSSSTPATLYCANLGDSRAVLGTLEKDGTFTAKALSVDHTAENFLERQSLKALHPHDPHVVVNLSARPNQPPSGSPDFQAEPPDWRVKKIAAFTRSIGDLQLKEKNTSALFNSYMAPENRIIPRPGIVGKHSSVPTPPYISSEPEIQQVQVPGMTRRDILNRSTNPSFVIIACDGVWDEMTSEEAVDCVGDLLSQFPSSKTNANIADLFIDKVLEQVVERLRETDPDEKDLTLEELKQRPRGKATEQSRSLLHDDITVIIIQLGSSRAFYRGRRGRSGRGLGGRNASMTSLKSLQKAMLRKNANRLSDPLQAVLERLKHNDPERVETDKQIVAMMDFFEGMNIRHLKILFNALDVDGNGTLDRDEVARLINQVMLTNVSSEVVDVAFEEMDADDSGAVDFFEFVSFFGHQAGIHEEKKDGMDRSYH